MTKVFDATKFRKSITKSISGLGIGFNDPTDWISTGNYALNYLISGDFNKGIPLGKVSVLAGESGAGKSYIASGNIIKNAQDQGIFVILFLNFVASNTLVIMSFIILHKASTVNN